MKEIGIKEGDRVLVKNLRETGGTGKLKSRWEHQIFEVVNQQGDLPVYRLRNMDNRKDVRTLHRNHIMKCEELPLDVFKEVQVEQPKQNPKIQRKPKATGKRVINRSAEEDPEEEESRRADIDDDEEYQLVVYPDESEQRENEAEWLDRGIPEDQLVTEETITTRGDIDPVLEEVEEVVEDQELEEGHEMDNESGDSDDEEDEEEPVRRSSRLRTSTKRFMFEKLGGNPSYTGVT